MAPALSTGNPLREFGSMLNRSQMLGKKGEKIASKYLKKLGYKILTENYTCKFGEIDIIAKEGKDLVFVEVKTRTNRKFGDPIESVHWNKQQQIIRVAQNYLAQLKNSEMQARFDVISILYPLTDRMQIEVIRNAFELT